MKNIVGISLTVLGAGAGFGAGFITAKKIYIKKVNKELKKLEETKEEVKEPVVDPAKEVAEKEDFKNSAVELHKRLEEDKKRYEEEAKLYGGAEGAPDKVEPKLVIITVDEFARSTNDSYTVYQYLDGEIVDDEYNVLEGYTLSIGAELKQMFDEAPQVSTLYFRDCTLGKDFEVLFCNKHLSEDK